jgi:uncharacterized protein
VGSEIAIREAERACLAAVLAMYRDEMLEENWDRKRATCLDIRCCISYAHLGALQRTSRLSGATPNAARFSFRKPSQDKVDVFL